MPPGIVVAGTHSGSGKTLVTLGLIAALSQRGMKVQPFKVGPDYLDPSHLSQVAGRPTRNLDSWLLPEATLRSLFASGMRDADFGVVEGVMGMHDGKSARGRLASTAEVASLLDLPVLLVIDIYGMARSAAAVAAGYIAYDPQVRIAGVLLNRAGSERHAQLVREALAERGIRVFGWLPKDPALSLPERHLGLVSAAEHPAAEVAQRAAGLIEHNFDIDGILQIARGPAKSVPVPPPPEGVPPRVRIAYALDEAFHFYYPDGLDLLRAAGAELVPFSPLKDPALPTGTQGVYLGGGYPELHAEALSANASLRAALVTFSEQGLPLYAECGGLMYIMDELVDLNGRVQKMCGVFPGRTRMGGGRGSLGYCEVRAVRDSLLLPQGSEVRAHEYHVSSLDSPHADFAYQVRNDLTGATKADGLSKAGRTLASYVHLHFASAGFLADRFVRAAQRV